VFANEGAVLVYEEVLEDGHVVSAARIHYTFCQKPSGSI
jgi:hypothetical protein